MNRGPIHLHIDELVLEGFNPGDRHGIADAVQRELHLLLAERGVPEAWHSSPERIVAQTVCTNTGAGAGLQIARAVHGGAAP